MKTIKINTHTARNAITDISKTWEGTVNQDWEEFQTEVPESWGQGSISGYQLSGGMGLFQFDCMFHDDVKLSVKDPADDPLVFTYCLVGEVAFNLEGKEECVCIKEYQNLILLSHNDQGYHIHFKKKTFIKVRIIKIQRDSFCKRFGLDLHEPKSYFAKLFKGAESGDSFYHDHMYSVILSHHFDEIEECKSRGLIRTVEIEGLTLQILGEQLSLYEDDLKDNGVQSILRQYEITCIHQAAEIIEDELEDLATVQQLAMRVGLNVNKLQDGFKIIFHNTVNGYVQEIRNKKANFLLHYSDLSISEIVSKLGLSSKSYFSKIFKEKYGISPSTYRSNKRNSKPVNVVSRGASIID